MRKEILFIYVIYLLNRLYIANNNDINIFVGNSFRHYYNLPSKHITCTYKNIKYRCKYYNQKDVKYHASIYNGNKFFPLKPNFTYNIIITTEKLSQVKFMKIIGDGKNKYYNLAVDYRLFNSKWHISKPYYSNVNFSYLVTAATSNLMNITSFMMRKNIVVYIQRVNYRNRQYIVKEMMKYLQVDSYGIDLNNRKWPKNISKNNKIEIYKKYKFCLAIENSIITWKIGDKYQASSINDDYVTEKLIDCFISGSIPIYFGPKNINLFLPHPDSIINFSSFSSIKSLADYVIRIMNNNSLLEKHIKWYNNISKEWINRFKLKFSFNYCKICNYVKIYSKSR